MWEQVRRRFVLQRLVGTLMIVEMKVAGQRLKHFLAALEIAGIDQFVFQRTPQAFDEHVVQGTSAAVHADGNGALLERSQELGGGELRALIGIPDFRLAEAERRIQRRQAEAGFQACWTVPN